MARINVNDNVWVKLTDLGREMHRAYWEPYSGGKYKAPPVSYDGWSRFQMHEVMRVFGSAMGAGCNVPFETEIILDCDRPVIFEGASNA